MDQIFNLISKEHHRQHDTLQMIPSENYASKNVRKAVGSILMNKYAEGQVGKRYYQGMVNADAVEQLCKDRALQTFHLDPTDWGVNVQPLSGCPANLSVYTALLKPGDTILSMLLPDGGHLSHGWHWREKPVSFPAHLYKDQHYSVDPKTKRFDLKNIEQIANKVKPKLIISGGTAYPREIDYKNMAKIAKQVGAYYLADVAHEAGLIAAGVNSSPFPYADAVTFTTHKTLRGPRGAIIIARKDLIDALDYAVFPGLQGGPHLHTIAGIAVALQETQSPAFKKYAKQVVTNAQMLAKQLEQAGLEVLTQGTDKHLVLVDLRNKNLSGWILAWALEYAGIITNRSTVPNETASPYFPSGLRLGTPFITTRGMKEQEMKQIAQWILAVIDHFKDAQLPDDIETRRQFTQEFRQQIVKDRFLKNIKAKVKLLCQRFPLP